MRGDLLGQGDSSRRRRATHRDNEWGRKLMTPDLDQVWRVLGLRNKNESLAFDAAPLAATRDGVTEGHSK
jgi:hypothetical protein